MRFIEAKDNEHTSAEVLYPIVPQQTDLRHWVSSSSLMSSV